MLGISTLKGVLPGQDNSPKNPRIFAVGWEITHNGTTTVFSTALASYRVFPVTFFHFCLKVHPSGKKSTTSDFLTYFTLKNTATGEWRGNHAQWCYDFFLSSVGFVRTFSCDLFFVLISKCLVISQSDPLGTRQNPSEPVRTRQTGEWRGNHAQ